MAEMDAPEMHVVDEFLHARTLHGNGGIIVRGVGEVQFISPGNFAACDFSHATSASMREALMTRK